ncbi:hypothetical protein ASC77_12590 [Nocardioides sp. Root1257]|nr:hypothetical protein ASC77_12590 [Nocardioides sp. Root1257]KRC45464.1 hypothetical protein ASE24_12595 [Nocardioides sp. Root224]
MIGRWLLLLVALGGLFAMHGLSDHGVGGPAALGSSVAHVDAHTGAGHQLGGGAASPGGMHGAAAAVADASVPAEMPADSSGGHDDHHGGGVLVGMCLAVLVAALLFGLAAWCARALARLWHVLAHDPVVAATTAFWARARGPAPPDLNLLSIQRC